MSSADSPANAFLPEPLPEQPLGLLEAWFREARQRAVQPNPDAMVLATVGADGSPAARVVLCKHIDSQLGYLAFFTNYHSRKGQELAGRPRAAAVLHWDVMHRQVRVEGAVVKSPGTESDQYFASRALNSRIGAWASDQSRPLASRTDLAAKVADAAIRFGVSAATTEAAVPRPSHWGGYRLWIERLELWVEGPGRVHDRAVWSRTLTASSPDSFSAGTWSATRLQP